MAGSVRKMQVIGRSHSFDGVVTGYDLVDINDEKHNVMHFSSEYVLNAILRKDMVVDKLRVSDDKTALLYIEPKKKQYVIDDEEEEETEDSGTGKRRRPLRRKKYTKRSHSTRKKR